MANDQEENLTNFNSLVLSSFLMGLYFALYLNVLYTYFRHKGPDDKQKQVVMLVITLLFLFAVAQVGIVLGQFNWLFSLFGTAEVSNTLLPPARTTSILHLISNIVYFGSFILADGLMIWRCYHVWEGSMAVISVPLALVMVDIVMFICMIGMFAARVTDITPEIGLRINILQLIQVLLPVATNIILTYLIARKIYTKTRPLDDASNFSSKKGRYMQVSEIVIQSAALYTLTLIVRAALEIPPTSLASRGGHIVMAYQWLDAIISVTSGMIPTAMVARVQWLRAKDIGTPQNISGIQFGADSTSSEESH